MAVTDGEEYVEGTLPHLPVIKIIGTGGAGNNTLDSLHALGVHGAHIIAANTDAQDLLDTKADKKILLGRELTRGLAQETTPQLANDLQSKAKNKSKPS